MDGACFHPECLECDIFRTVMNSAYYPILPLPYTVMALDLAYIKDLKKIKCSVITHTCLIGNYHYLINVILSNKHVIGFYSH